MATLCDLCGYLCDLCVKANAESEKTRQCVLDRQETQSSQSEARRGRKEEESRGSVFVNFAKYLCVLCVRTNAKDLRKRQGGSDRQKTQRPQSEAREGRKEEESRGSVFVNFATVLAFFALEPIRKM